MLYWQRVKVSRKQVWIGLLVALLMGSLALWKGSRKRTAEPVEIPVTRVEPQVTVEPPLVVAPQSEAPRYFTYDIHSWRSLLPAPFVLPRPPQRVHEQGATSPSSAAPQTPDLESAGPTASRLFELYGDWRSLDRQRILEGNWDHFLRKRVDPLLIDSDGFSFYNPSELRVNAPLPIQLPKAYGFGVKFRLSF